MRYVIILATALRFLTSSSEDVKFHFNSDEFIEMVKANATTWEAGRNFDKDVPESYIVGLLGVLPQPTQGKLSYRTSSHRLANIPKDFDARTHWPFCSSMNEIRSQGRCGSCWAVSAAAAMTDRICIATQGEIYFYVSEENLLSCCYECGHGGFGGCRGGYTILAWKYWVEHGIVSGGSFGSNEGCQPYQIASLEDVHKGRLNLSEYKSQKLPPCSKQCRIGYSSPYSEDLSRGLDWYHIPIDVQAIQSEIMIHGPVEADFQIFPDFLHYKSGIYHHTIGTYQGLHAVKIIGWGEEKGTPYWLVANSWGASWGEGGFFKFLRGKNHCLIERNMVAGRVNV